MSEISQAKSERKPLSRTLKLFFGIGDLGFSLMTSVSMYYLNYFLTDVARFTLPMVALVSTLPAVVDAFSSPLYGAVIEIVPPMRWGKIRSWLIIAPWMLIFCIPFQYSVIGSPTTAAIIMITASIISKPAVNIPFNANLALVPEIAPSPEDIMLLNSRRSFWQSWSRFLWALINVPLIAFFANVLGSPSRGYTGLSFVCTLSAILGYAAHFAMTKGYETLPDPQSRKSQAGRQAQKKDKASGSDLLGNLFKNPSLLLFLLGDFGIQLAGFIGTACLAYVYNTVFGDPSKMTVVVTASAVATMVSSLALPLLTKRFAPRTIMIAGTFAGAILTAARAFMYSNVWLFIAMSVLASIPMTFSNVGKQSIYADLAVLGEYKTGKDVKSFVIGMQTMPLKFANMARTIAIATGLALIGYKAGGPVTDSIKSGIIVLAVIIPAVGMLLCGLVVLFINIPKEKVAEMRAFNDERKRQESQAGQNE